MATLRLCVSLWAGSILSLALSAPSFAADVAIETRNIRPGVDYLHKRVKSVPWSIHVLRAERHRPELDLATTLPSGEWIGLSPASAQVKFIPSSLGLPIGAVNGDFFSWRKGPYQGDVAGLQITNGELVSAPHLRSKRDDAPEGLVCVWVDEKRNPHLGKVTPDFAVTWPDRKKTPFQLNEACDDDKAVLYTHVAGYSTRTTNGLELVLERDGDKPWLPLQIGEKYSARIAEIGKTNSLITSNTLVLFIGSKLLPKLSPPKPGMLLKISTATTPLLKNVNTAIGGGPVLVRNGKAPNLRMELVRHPRAAFGWNSKYYFFVVVDGRRAGVSDGMTFMELAKEMESWDCDEAMNLDGGGSAMLWVDGEIRNQPSENRERPCANALVLVRKEK